MTGEVFTRLNSPLAKMRYTKTLPIKILVLSPRSEADSPLEPFLSHPDLSVETTHTLQAFRQSLSQTKPHVVAIYGHPQAVLKKLEHFAPALKSASPAVVIHQHISESEGASLLEAGFADFISLKDLTHEALFRSFRLLTQAHVREIEVTYLKETDNLTKVGNRAQFCQMVSRQIPHLKAKHEAAALILADIDDFRSFNRRMGYSAGDKVLRDFCNRLLQSAYPCPVYRVGVDEFAIWVTAKTPEKVHLQLQEVLESLALAMHAPFSVDDNESLLSSSLGITLIPEHGTQLDALLNQACQAKVRAKQKSGYTYSVFEPEKDLPYSENLQLETDIWAALKLEQFELYYQPRIDLLSGEVVGAEALMRWNHPEHGLIMPADFIPIAERNGQIVPMGYWAIQQAGKDLKHLREQGYHLPKLGVNLSFSQFKHEHLASTIQRLIEAEEIDTRVLEFELTESSLFSDDQHVRHSIDALCQTGIDFSLDDFGTGYSSFSLLQKLPVSTLKIDRSFVAKLPNSSEDTEIVRAVISLAHNLNKSVIAEGVENRAQLEFLIQHDCDQVQGFYYSKPVPLAQFKKMLHGSLPLAHL